MIETYRKELLNLITYRVWLLKQYVTTEEKEQSKTIRREIEQADLRLEYLNITIEKLKKNETNQK